MKRTLAGGVLGLGIGLSGGVAGTADDIERDADGAVQHDEHEHHPDLVLVFAYDYHSNALFRPVDRLPQDAVNAILGDQMTDGDPVVSEPTDYNGYVVLVETYPNAPGEYAFAFVNEQTLQEDQWYQFTDDVVFFDTDVNLLSVGLTTADDVRETLTSEETTTTAAETTTQDVVVRTTETTDGR